jgi:hypothetical protein
LAIPLLLATRAAVALGEPVEAARPLFQQPLPLGRMLGGRYRVASGQGSVSGFTAAGGAEPA